MSLCTEDEEDLVAVGVNGTEWLLHSHRVYQVGQLYSAAEASKNETGGGEGIGILKNEPYEKDGERGQYTHKIYHLKSIQDYKADEDPAVFKTVKTGRGPLGPNWKKELVNNPDCPRMCSYQLLTVKFKWWGLQNTVESFIHKHEKRIFTNFHRQLFCWIDQWVDLSMEDIRRMEEETQEELEELRKQGPVTSAADE
ncbi:phosphatidylinositol transfer protein beta isoform-like [Garra rufa]|uniref:phosphatidylinositol transfer protein beta isoform-like n=1 Tax=Garra rufa TaxID=137080 RepID=UPI003CCEAFC3